MLMRFSLVMALSLMIAGVGLLVGCNNTTENSTGSNPETPTAEESEDDYNPHDMPITDEQESQLRSETAQFPAAVAKIAELRDAVKEGTANGIPENPYETHQALDKVDLVLQWLPEIADSFGVPTEHWEEINTSANDLRNSFEQVHQNIDSKQDPDFAGVAETINQKIVRLQEIAESKPATTGEQE